MSHLHPVDKPVVNDGSGASAPSVLSQIPSPPSKLTAREKKVWDHITEALLEYGLVHLTDGILLTVICKTFVQWVDANKELEDFKKGNGGKINVTTPNGYSQPHQIYYVVRDLKKELLQWLPEAALTIPSFVKVKSTRLDDVAQGDLFNDPVEEFKKKKVAAGMRVVK